MKALTAEQCVARAEALEECAEHLYQDWTDDRVERKQGEIIAEQLRARAGKFRDMATERN